jgi:hypothetical protein
LDSELAIEMGSAGKTRFKADIENTSIALNQLSAGKADSQRINITQWSSPSCLLEEATERRGVHQ